MKKNIISALILILSIVIMVTGIYKINDYKKARTFTQETWLKQPHYRSIIVKDMMKKYNLTGMSKDEIVNLLGPPSPAPSGFVRRIDNKDWKTEEFSDAVYYLFNSIGYPEGTALYIAFDERDMVVEYCLVAYGT